MSGMIAKAKAIEVLQACRRHGVLLTTAESCTGGLIVASLTDIAGSSDVVDRGFVTYSNNAKHEMIGVPAELIAKHGAVSKEVALSMATGALEHSNAGIAISVTGIAGPGGGTAAKPVGLVWFGLAFGEKQPVATRRVFDDQGRASIRTAAVNTALDILLEALP
ncbi:CinA family protein [Phyllobacterium endophyticum]|uniref:Damage-inducible protein CinA n=1 Tax=Phyllobacterium endophyticum TaxID=1149773 RepID=A0A2P7AVG8_9HYPH|nr:CinA family protein [Phyllobacterium endophyticum]MBB3234729.1 nicotinamide-nucleotide amidase [Phyllobacterium endophyticum]PSH58181.1 damage-inducible protein CinA [Phyllobacterium endophyticum]TYR38858.1 CinA family protein [Phyllobacterium endophyticum]